MTYPKAAYDAVKQALAEAIGIDTYGITLQLAKQAAKHDRKDRYGYMARKWGIFGVRDVIAIMSEIKEGKR